MAASEGITGGSGTVKRRGLKTLGRSPRLGCGLLANCRSFTASVFLGCGHERRRIFRNSFGAIQHLRSGLRYQKNNRPITTEEARATIGLRPDERFALVCPNIPFDASYRDLLNRFSSMREWLIESVKYLVERPEIRTVVRAYPHENHPALGDEKIDVVLRRARIDMDRIIMLPGAHPLNTYALMPLCDFGVVFSSTTGVEMAMHGKTVIPGADIHYCNRGFTLDSTDRADYFKKLGELASGLHRPSLRAAGDAAMLYAMLHLLVQWPYPYAKMSEIARTPPRALVRNGEMSRYVDTLDVLAIPPDEWPQRVGEYMNVDAVRRRLCDEA